MSRGPDAATLLDRALRADAARAGLALDIAEAVATRWASATFTGVRHALTLTIDTADAADAWLAALPDADLPLRGHLVADAAVMRSERSGRQIRAAIEVLTVEDR